MSQDKVDCVSGVRDLFRGKVNLLLVEDNPGDLRLLRMAFDSPLLNVATARSFSEAEKVIRTGSENWHCWIVDVNLGGHNGFELMRLRPNFPFVYFVTGIKSPSLGADAMKLGAMDVFEKGTDSLDFILGEVCRTAALGFVLGGKPTKDLNAFKVLYNDGIMTPTQWTARACIGLRQVHRICNPYPHKTPQYLISLFRALSYVMRHTDGMEFSDSKDAGWRPNPAFFPQYAACMKHVLRIAEGEGPRVVKR